MGRGSQFVFFALALTAASVAQSASGTQSEFHRTYPLDRSQQVFIRNFYGNVHVSAWDRQEIKIDAGTRPGSDKPLDIMIDSQSDRFCIATRYPSAHRNVRNWFGLTDDPCRNRRRFDRTDVATVDYTILVPREAQVTLLNDEGNVDIDGTAGRLFVDMDEGHLTVRDVSGDCKLFGSYSGVNVTLTKVPRDTHLTTAVGPLIVYLVPELSARVHAHANSGAVFNDFGWPRKPHEDLQAQLGSSGPLLDLTNFNGRVDIRHLQPPARAKAQVPKAH